MTEVDLTAWQEYVVETVRVVNSPKLWDNRIKVAYRSKHFAWAYVSLLVAFIFVLSALTNKNYQTITSSSSKINKAVTLSATDTHPPKDFDNILIPTQDDHTHFMLQILATYMLPPPDCQKEKCVALTFDDGPNNDSTPVILSTLEKYNARATFFLIGNKVNLNTAIVQRMYRDGNEIGNHSWSHTSFSRISNAKIQEQVGLTQAAITATGVSAPTLLRPPYGVINQTIANRINMSIVLWNVDPKDWSQKDPNMLAEIVVAQARSGGIIVMHDLPLTAIAMDKIVADLVETKYRLVTVSQLLGLNSDSRGIYFGR